LFDCLLGPVITRVLRVEVMEYVLCAICCPCSQHAVLLVIQLTAASDGHKTRVPAPGIGNYLAQRYSFSVILASQAGLIKPIELPYGSFSLVNISPGLSSLG
jgi:hypothetical protein